MADKITTISPITNQPIIVRPEATEPELARLVDVAQKAFKTWSKTTLSERLEIVNKALKHLSEQQDEYGKQITEMMGRPIAYTAKEVSTAVMRGEYLVKISESALADTPGEEEAGFKRLIRKMPVGPVLILFPWNVCIPSPITLHIVSSY